MNVSPTAHAWWALCVINITPIPFVFVCYRQWRVVSLDGSTSGRGRYRSQSALFGSTGCLAWSERFAVGLVESGTHSIFGVNVGPYEQGEITLAKTLPARLRAGMLCLADRNFLGYQLWQQARSTGADLLWRAKQSSRFDVLETYQDGYYLSCLFSHPELRRRGKAGQEVRVIDYQLKGPSRRAVLSAGHIDFGFTTSSGRSTGAFVWSALGTAKRIGRTQNPSARSAGGIAQQNSPISLGRRELPPSLGRSSGVRLSCSAGTGSRRSDCSLA